MEVERNIGGPYSDCQHQHNHISVPNRNASNINENLIPGNCRCCVIVDDVRAKDDQQRRHGCGQTQKELVRHERQGDKRFLGDENA